MGKNYSEKGITLIALIVTVLALLILATVTINIVINNNLLDNSEKTVDNYKVLDYKERIEVAKTNLHTDKILNRDKHSKLNKLLVDKLKEENWVNDAWTAEENSDLTDDEFEVLTNDGYLITAEIVENGAIIYKDVIRDNGEPYPNITLEALPLQGTENEKLKIKVTATVAKKRKTKKVEKIILENTNEEKEYTEGGVIFEVALKGEYVFKAVTDQGKTRSQKITMNIQGTDNEIIADINPSVPRNTIKTEAQNGKETGPIIVNLDYGETNLQKRYKKEGDTDWTYVEESSVNITGITENITIISGYYDGTNSFNNKMINIQNVDNVAPNAFNVTLTNKTTNSITVSASTIDTASTGAASDTSGILRYEYKLNDGNWESVGLETSKTYTDLTTGTYTIQAKAIDKAGNETISSNTLNESLKELDAILGEDKITISATPTEPRNTTTGANINGIARGPISVTIEYGNNDNSYTRQYKIGEGTWQDEATQTKTFTVTENTTILARYYDGTNGFETDTYNIQNVDNVAPNAFNVTLTNKTTNSITVSANTIDTASTGSASDTSGILRYEYKLNDGNWESVGLETSKTYTGLTKGTYTIQAKAIDKAGNETISSNTLNESLKELDATTGEDKITISATPTEPRNTTTGADINGIARGPISVTIEYSNSESNYTKQYKIGDGGWQDVTTQTKTFTVTENTAIVARYYDGTNGFESDTYNIQNVDNVAPNITSLTATPNGAKIIVSANATDTASDGAATTTSGIAKKLYRLGTGTWQESNELAVTESGKHTVEIKAIDYAGNEKTESTTVTVQGLKITINNGDGMTTSIGKSTVILGETTTISATGTDGIAGVRDGYEFDRWEIMSGSAIIENNRSASTTITPTTNVTIKAVSKAKHMWGESENILEANCTDKGINRTICTNCEEYVDEELPALGHSQSSSYSSSSAGHYHSCSRCGLRLTEVQSHSSNPCTICGYTGIFNVSYELSKMTASNTATTATAGSSYSTIITPVNSLSYQRPESVTIKMGGVVLTSGYTYNSVDGSIRINNITGDVVISASAARYYGGNTSFSNAMEVELNENLSADLDQSYRIRAFAFTPTTSGTYRFYSADSVADTRSTDPYGYLFDASTHSLDDLDEIALQYAQTGSTSYLDNACLIKDDDGGNGYNFSFTYNCTAGRTYYLVVRTYTPSYVQSFTNIYIVQN